MFIEHVKLALSGLRSNKMRSLLTMLGIIIGIGSVIAIMSVGNSLTSSVTESMSSLGTTNITVSLSQKSTNSTETNRAGMVFGTTNKQQQVSDDDYYSTIMIEDIVAEFEDSIDAVVVSETVGMGTASVDSTSGNVNIIGANLGYYVSNDLTLLAGSFFSERDFNKGAKVVLIADDLATSLYGPMYEMAIGQPIELNYNNKYEMYYVIGVYDFDESSAFSMSSSSITTSLYIPLLTAQEITHNKLYSSFTIVAKSGLDLAVFTEDLTNYINERYYYTNDSYEANAYNAASMIETLTSMLTTITIAIAVIAGISLLVGGIGVMNIMLVSVSERTNEIGTRKALGATNANIQSQFIIESAIICLIGGIIGVILGLTLGYIGSLIMGFTATPSYISIVVSLLFSISIGIFFGYYPAKKAANMNPIDALRY